MKKFNTRWIYLTALIIIIVFIAATGSKKISDLTELTDLDTGDWLVVVDSSAAATRKLNTSRLNPYAASVGFDALAIDTLTVSDSANIGDLIVGDSLYVTDDLVVGDDVTLHGTLQCTTAVISDSMYVDTLTTAYFEATDGTFSNDIIGSGLYVGTEDKVPSQKNIEAEGEIKSATGNITDSLFVGSKTTLTGTTTIDSILILTPAVKPGAGETVGTIMMDVSDSTLYCWDGVKWNSLW